MAVDVYAWRCLECSEGRGGTRQEAELDVREHTRNTDHSALAMPLDPHPRPE